MPLKTQQKGKAPLPKAKDITKALQNIPKWASAVVIPPRLIQVFDANPGLMGALTPELMEKFNAETEGKLAQVEMANAFYDSLVLAVGAHEEIEELRAKSVALMYDTKTREEDSVMDALLAGTKYEQHLVQWRHELAAKQGLLKDETEYINATVTVDVSVKLQKAFSDNQKIQTRLNASLVEEAATQVVDVEALQQKEVAAVEQRSARANFQRLIKRG